MSHGYFLLKPKSLKITVVIFLVTAVIFKQNRLTNRNFALIMHIVATKLKVERSKKGKKNEKKYF